MKNYEYKRGGILLKWGVPFRYRVEISLLFLELGQLYLIQFALLAS